MPAHFTRKGSVPATDPIYSGGSTVTVARLPKRSSARPTGQPAAPKQKGKREKPVVSRRRVRAAAAS